MKKISSILIGILLSIICLETVFQIIRPQMLFDTLIEHDGVNMDIKDSFMYKFFKYLYLDIYDNYYKLDKNNIYRVQRIGPFLSRNLKEKFFNKKKQKDVKRIFIVGESVAEFYPKENLEQNLKYFIPDKKFEIINAGTGSYDSVRISKIVKEIVNYHPDYIIILIGNNDGIFKPIEINYLPYRYKLFRKSYILNRLSNYLVRRKYYSFENIQPFFEENIVKILKHTKNVCPIFFVTLPHNLQYKFGNFLDNFPLINDEEDLHRENIFIQRRNFIRQLTEKYSWVHIIDFDKELKKYIYPGYKVFMDNDHYHPGFYDLISKLFIAEFSNNFVNIDKNYINDIVKNNLNEIENCVSITIDNVNYNEVVKIIRELYFYDKHKLKEVLLKKYLEEYVEAEFSNLFVCLHILILYDNDKDFLFSYFDKIDRLGICNEDYYLLKSLAYIKYNNINKAKEYLSLAKKLDKHNEIQISIEEIAKYLLKNKIIEQ